MRRVKSTDTSPEMRVRRALHRQGYRYRLHVKGLPGTPDLVFPRRRKVIFVHGCFWHGHDCVRGARTPKRNRDYWISKIDRNRERHANVVEELQAMGWRVLTVWECDLANVRFEDSLKAMREFLEAP